MQLRILATAEELNGLLSLNNCSFTFSSSTKTSSSLPPLTSSSTLWHRRFRRAVVIIVVVVLAAAAHIAPHNLHFWRLLSLCPLIRHLQQTLENSFKLLMKTPIEWDRVAGRSRSRLHLQILAFF